MCKKRKKWMLCLRVFFNKVMFLVKIKYIWLVFLFLKNLMVIRDF